MGLQTLFLPLRRTSLILKSSTIPWSTPVEGRGFNPAMNRWREAPSFAQLHPRHVSSGFMPSRMWLGRSHRSRRNRHGRSLVMSEQTRSLPGARALALCYVLGFVACFLSQVIVSRQQGPVVYTNVLFAVVFVFREWLGQFSIVTHHQANLAAEIISSSLVAIFFPAALSLFRSERRVLRLLSLILLGILALMTLWWGRFPNI